MGHFIRFTSVLQCANRVFYSSVAAVSPVKVNKSYFKSYKRDTKFFEIIASNSLINKKLQSNEVMDDCQWAAARTDLKENYNLTEINVDAKIYQLCQHYERIDEAMNYFKFLKRNNYNINIGLLGDYINIFYLKSQPLSCEEEEEIFNIYDDLRAKYQVLDGKTCSNCIFALSVTKRWKETLLLLNMYKVTNTPNAKLMSAIIKAAVRNNDSALAWKLMNETIQSRPLENFVYKEYSNVCKNITDKNELQSKVEKMFFFWAEHDIKPDEEVVKEYANLYESVGFTAEPSTISTHGVCSHCGEMLNTINFSKNDFKQLSTSVLNNLIVGKNIYCATSPQELKSYLMFVKTMKPYDVVIDGLNVAFSGSKEKKGSLQKVLNVAKHFYNNKKRILIIGRTHMNWWSRDTMSALHDIADVYLIKNISEDDPFLLHVTLLSGPQTYFVSRDLMRQHRFKLEKSNLKIMFKAWQLSRQYKYLTQSNNDYIHVIPPLSFDISAQQRDGNWHIPYTALNQANNTEENPIPENWFCITKKKQ